MRFWASRISKQVGVPWRSCLTSRRAGRERISRSCNGLPNALQARRADHGRQGERTARAELAELRTAVALLHPERQAAAELADSLDQLTDAVTRERRLAVDDLTMRNVRGLAEVWEVLNTWDISRNPERRLGDAIKVLPAQEVSRIIAALRAGLA